MATIDGNDREMKEPERVTAEGETGMSHQETRDMLFAELRRITAAWNIFDDVPKEQMALCRQIGVRLCALDGEALMCEAYYDAKSANPAATVIQAYWDGIGDWKW